MAAPTINCQEAYGPETRPSTWRWTCRWTGAMATKRGAWDGGVTEGTEWERRAGNDGRNESGRAGAKRRPKRRLLRSWDRAKRAGGFRSVGTARDEQPKKEPAGKGTRQGGRRGEPSGGALRRGLRSRAAWPARPCLRGCPQDEQQVVAAGQLRQAVAQRHGCVPRAGPRVDAAEGGG